MRSEMTITEYAQYRKKKGLPGGTRTAVYKALKASRITKLPSGKISPAKADKEWETKSKLAMRVF